MTGGYGGYKTCAVPLCRNNNRNAPSKYFFIFPFGKQNLHIRNLWFDIIQRDNNVSLKSKFYCCEDHFDIVKDTVNYYPYTYDKTIKLKLKPNVVPHKFDCQKYINTYVRTPFKKKMKIPAQNPEASTSQVRLEVEEADEPLEEKYSPQVIYLNETRNECQETESIDSFIKQEVVEPMDEKDFPQIVHLDETKEEPSSLYIKQEVVEFGDPMEEKYSPEHIYLDESIHEEPKDPRSVQEEIPKLFFINRGVQVCREDFENERGVQIRGLTKFRSKTVQTQIKQRDVGLSPLFPSKRVSNKLKKRKSKQPPKRSTKKLKQEPIDDSTESESSYSSVCQEEQTAKKQSPRVNLMRITVGTIGKNSQIFLGLPSLCYYIVKILQHSITACVRDILITLRKIRLNEPSAVLGIYFELEISEINEIFRTTIPKMGTKLRQLIHWPSHEKLRKRIPTPFRARYSRVTSIIDCLEIQIEKPNDPLQQSCTWSQDKACNTFKYLISYTPEGLISFVSGGFGGKASDVDLIEGSGYLNKLFGGMWIMADGHFNHLSSLFQEVGCKFIKAPNVLGKEFNKVKIEKLSKNIADFRILVERVMKRIREFHMLKPNACIEMQHFDLVDNIVVIACAIVNIQTY